jgi:ADP-heptose:LPS heptosyltransferase
MKKKKKPFRHRFAQTLQFMAKRRKKQPFPDKPLESIVILAKERYGDSIMLTPLIGALRKEFPELSISIITFSQIVFNFFSSDTNVTAVYYTKKNLTRYYNGILSKKFDLLFNPKDHPSTNFLIHSTLIRARQKIGHFNFFHEGLYDHLIDLPLHTHESEKNLSLLKLIGADREHLHYKPYLPPLPVSEHITTFLKTLEPGKCIGINISAGHDGGHRTVNQWSELIRSFPNNTFIIFSVPDDLEEKRELEQQHANVQPSPSTGNLNEVGEIVKNLKILISPDTALIHVASCFDTPLLGLYRKSLVDHNQFGPLSQIQAVIVSPTPDVVDIESDRIAASLREMIRKLP